jgi:hypothetical protein
MNSIFGLLTWTIIFLSLFFIRSFYGFEGVIGFSLNLLLYFVLTTPISAFLPSAFDLPAVVALVFYRPFNSTFASSIYSNFVIKLLSPVSLFIESFMTVLSIQGIGQFGQLVLERFENSNDTTKLFSFKGLIVAHFFFSSIYFVLFLMENQSIFINNYYLESFSVILVFLFILTLKNEFVMITDFSFLLNYIHINFALIHHERIDGARLSFVIDYLAYFIPTFSNMTQILSLGMFLIVIYRVLILRLGYFFFCVLRGEPSGNSFDMPKSIISALWKPSLLIVLTQSFSDTGNVDFRLANILLTLALYGFTVFSTDMEDSESWKENLRSIL